MKLHYYLSQRGNFGDDLNPRFFQSICPGYESINKAKLFGIGTLLNSSTGKIENSIIFGSGYGQGSPPIIDQISTNVLGVRGPITAMSLGLDPDDVVIGDPALYIPKIHSFNNGKSKGKRYVLALHHRTAEYWNFNNIQSNNFCFLDPTTAGIDEYIATIKSADLVFAESLHGAIICSAFGIPFIRTGLLNKVDETKWMDYFLSLKISNLPTSYPLPTPKPIIGRRHILALINRNILPENYFHTRYRDVTEQELQTIEKSASKLITTSNIIHTKKAHLNELQNKFEDAIDKLNKLSTVQL